MRRVTLLDTETTTISPSSGHIIEIAVILYDLLRATPITTFATLLKLPEGVSNGAEGVNKISNPLLQEIPAYATMASHVVADIVEDSDAIVAHFADFDKRWIDASKILTDCKQPPWICSGRRIHWPIKTKAMNLVDLCLGHGVPVISAHRALTDCDLLARLLTRVHELGHDLVQMMEQAHTPHVLVVANVSKAEKDLPKGAGFEWDRSEEFPRRWLKEMTEEDMRKLTFPTSILRPCQ